MYSTQGNWITGGTWTESGSSFHTSRWCVSKYVTCRMQDISRLHLHFICTASVTPIQHHWQWTWLSKGNHNIKLATSVHSHVLRSVFQSWHHPKHMPAYTLNHTKQVGCQWGSRSQQADAARHMILPLCTGTAGWTHLGLCTCVRCPSTSPVCNVSGQE